MRSLLTKDLQVYIYLGQDNTRWMTGAASRKDGELFEFQEQSVNGNPSLGWVDAGGTNPSLRIPYILSLSREKDVESKY